MSDKQISNNISGSAEGNLIFGDGEGNEMIYQNNQAPAPPEPEQIKFKDLLNQLKEAVEADSNFNPEQKQEFLEQFKILEEAVKNPNDREKKQQADRVGYALKTTIKMLSPAGQFVQFVESCKNLFPLITKVFGL